MISDRYEVVRKIGEGSFSSIFLAKVVKNEEGDFIDSPSPIALKIMNKGYLDSINYIQYIVAEKEILCKVRGKHPFVCDFQGVHQTQNFISFHFSFLKL